jgi:hypothetical protein
MKNIPSQGIYRLNAYPGFDNYHKIDPYFDPGNIVFIVSPYLYPKII